MSKEEWKSTGKELGGAFKGLAKSLVRSAKQGVEDAEEWAKSDENAPKEPKPEESTVFNDGTWRETGKSLGHAFTNLGKTLVKTGEEVVEDLENDKKDE